MVRYDLVQAARSLAPEALGTLEHMMRHAEDERVRVMASVAILERAYGKPLQTIDASTTHKFVVAPSVMSKSDWLRTRGDAKLLDLSPSTAAAVARETHPDAQTMLNRDPPPDDGKLN